MSDEANTGFLLLLAAVGALIALGLWFAYRPPPPLELPPRVEACDECGVDKEEVE